MSFTSQRPPTIGQETPDRCVSEVPRPSHLLRDTVSPCRLVLDMPRKHDHENSSPKPSSATPPALRWAESMSVLLDDSEGVKLFRKFLEQEGRSNVLDFYFACLGVKRCRVDADKLPSLAKQILKRFVRPEDGVRLSEDTRYCLQQKISNKDVKGPEVFDEALNEVEVILREELYPLFLNSDIFVQYVQTGGASTGAQSPASNASSRALPEVLEDRIIEESRLVTDVPGSSRELPDVPEDDELLVPSQPPRHKALKLNPDTLYVTQMSRANMMEQFASHLPGAKHISPYHVHPSYAPASKQESELASLSSDAMTENTDSSSRDGSHRFAKSRSYMMKHLARKNPEVSLHEHIIPRTERAPKERSLAEVNPTEFAAKLIDRLNKVIRERETSEKVQHSLRGISEIEEERSRTGDSTILTFADVLSAPKEDAESILEDHMSIVWKEPLAKQRGRKQQADWRLREHMYGSMDSGMGIDERRDESRRSDSVMTSSLDGDRHRHKHTLAVFDSPRSRYRSDSDKARGGRKSSRRPTDLVSNVDSGISGMSGAYSDGSRMPPIPNLRDPKNERVMSWMNESDCIRSTGAHRSNSDHSSSHKRSHHKSSKKSSSGKDWSADPNSYLVAAVSASNDDDKLGKDRRSPQHSRASHRSQETDVDRKKMSSRGATSGAVGAQLVVMYQLCDEEVPYRITVQGSCLTLAQFKSHIAKRGNYRYFFKRLCPEEPETSSCQGALFDEVTDETETLPLWHGRVFAKVLQACGMDVPTGSVRVLLLFDDEQTPLRCHAPNTGLTLGQFKQQLVKKANYKCYFKTASEEFGPGGVVFEEITDQSQMLPFWNGQIVARLQKMD